MPATSEINATYMLYSLSVCVLLLSSSYKRFLSFILFTFVPTLHAFNPALEPVWYCFQRPLKFFACKIVYRVKMPKEKKQHFAGMSMYFDRYFEKLDFFWRVLFFIICYSVYHMSTRSSQTIVSYALFCMSPYKSLPLK